MKLLLGSLLLAGISWLGAALVIPIMQNFSPRRIAKLWYPLLHLPTGQVVSTHFHPFRLEAQSNGGLKYRIRFPVNGQCRIEQAALNERGQPGYYANREIPFTVQFVEVDYCSYMIAYLTRGSNNEETFLALAGVQPILTPDLETRFRQVANSLGITGEFVRPILKETC